jgi:exodeoxyribonuclease VII large subunit
VFLRICASQKRSYNMRLESSAILHIKTVMPKRINQPAPMDDLFASSPATRPDTKPTAPPEPLKATPAILSVSALTRQIKATLCKTFSNVWVEGEISNLRIQQSGHVYFTLKDAGAQLSIVLFRREASLLNFKLADGQQVVVHGDVDVYEPRGNYQLIARLVQQKGVGQLQAQFEALKQKLAAEGLFDPARKKPIPPFPEHIGIVTSPTGAAIRDILNVINRRFPNVHIVIAPVRVQGDGAAQEIAAAIDELNALHAQRTLTLDVLIIARGGGSLEDLWAFNEEIVARAVARSKIPTISAVGHEIDFTICDFVADLRAPTPSAAAELVVSHQLELLEHVRDLRARLHRGVARFFEVLDHRVARAAGSYVFREPVNVVRNYQQRVDGLLSEIEGRATALLDRLRHRVESASGKLSLLNPRATLQRGYSITQRADGRVVTSAQQVKRGDHLKTIVRDGEIESEAK